jgi:hypothetical protein
MIGLFLVVDFAGVGIHFDLEALAGTVEPLGLVTAAVSADLLDLRVAFRCQLGLDGGTVIGVPEPEQDLGEGGLGQEGEGRPWWDRNLRIIQFPIVGRDRTGRETMSLTTG